MYTQYLQLEDSKTGKGVFSTVRIPANVMIIEMSGPVVNFDDMAKVPADYLQIGPNSFMGMSGSFAPDFLNHSCDPNCKMHVVGNRAFLYSLYVIPVGAELTFDYSTTSTDTLDTWQMGCKCGSYKCRKVISGVQYLDTPLFNNYKDRGMLPMYILEPSIFQKR